MSKKQKEKEKEANAAAAGPRQEDTIHNKQIDVDHKALILRVPSPCS
jgi:hypothetical protein